MGRTLPLTAQRTDVRATSDERPTAATVLGQCVHPERRIVLAVLCESGSLSLGALAGHVAARRRGISVAEVTDDAREQTEIGLYHNHLQKLSEAGVVEHADDGDGTTVAIASALEPGRICELIETGEGSWTAIDAVFTDDRRLHVTAHLASAGESLTLEELAEAVATLECEEADIPHGETIESVRVSLHHVHLPKLADADVLSYDHDEGHVAFEGLPDACEEVVGDEPWAVPA